MTIWHLLSIWQQLSILHRHLALPLWAPHAVFCKPLSLSTPLFLIPMRLFWASLFPHIQATTESNGGFIRYAGKEKDTSGSTDISSTILFMLYWELTSQSNESHSSVNIRRISFHPKKADQAQRLYGATGRCDAIALLVLSSWNQFEQGGRRQQKAPRRRRDQLESQMHGATLYSPTFLLGGWLQPISTPLALGGE